MILLRILIWLGIVNGCWLKDYKGEVKLSAYKVDGFDQKIAWVYYWTKIGHIILNNDYTTSGEACYIKEWKPVAKRARI